MSDHRTRTPVRGITLRAARDTAEEMRDLGMAFQWLADESSELRGLLARVESRMAMVERVDAATAAADGVRVAIWKWAAGVAAAVVAALIIGWLAGRVS